MSSRAIRRLREEKEAALPFLEQNISDDEDEEETPQKGRFLGMLHEDETS